MERLIPARLHAGPKILRFLASLARAGRPLTAAVLVACACGADALGQATEPNALPSPLRAGKSPQLLFGGTAVKLELDNQRLANLRNRGGVQLSEFTLAPRAAGEPPRTVTLRLRRMNVFGPQTRFVLGDPTGQGREIDLPLPDAMIFQGTIVGEADSDVFLAFSDYGTYGFVNSAHSLQIISSGPAKDPDDPVGDVMIYDPRVLPEGAIHWRDFVCGTAAPEGAPPMNIGGIAGTPTCSNVWLAIETDFEFTNDLFSGNLNAAANYVTVMTAAASNRLTLNINSRLRLRYVRLWNNPADPWNAATSGDQLDQFREVWEANMEGVQRHLAHFLSGRDLGGGVAWLATMCNPDWGYGVSSNLDGFFPTPLVNNHPQNWDIYVYCHELGHNFGTTHTHNFCPPVDLCAAEEAWGDCQNSTVCINNGTIMSYCHTCAGGLSNIVLSYHPVPSQAMLEHLATVPPKWCSLECISETLLVPQEYDNIQDAIDAAYDGDEIVLADGVYFGAGTNANLSFRGKDLTVRSASGNPAACIIDCDHIGTQWAISLTDGETLASTISGLTFRGISPDFEGTSAVRIDGGATFINCVFTDNVGSLGPAATVFAGEVVFRDCSFIDNQATGLPGQGGIGGAIFSPGSIHLENCLFEGNTASVAAGAVASGGELIARGCTFRNNTADALGVGALLSQWTTTLHNCTFIDNRCLGPGADAGAVAVGSAVSHVISNCSFFNNRAGPSTGRGGAVHVEQGDAAIVNCLFSGNRAGSAAGNGGGAISVTAPAHARIANCTFAGNTASVGSGVDAFSASATLTNCIFWGNTGSALAHEGTGSLQVSFSDIQGGFAGTGNIDLNPMFNDADGADNIVGTEDDDLRVASDSPVIDVGTGVPLHFQRAAEQWLTLRPGAQSATFDQFYPGSAGGTGCLSGPTNPAVSKLDGGTMTVTAFTTTGSATCAIIDGSTPGGQVSDAALSTPGARLRLLFEPPITAFYSFYGSLNTGTTGSMRLFHEGAEVGLLTSLPSPHATSATGHGFSSLVPIDEVEVTVTDSSSVMGAFTTISSGETSLGTTNIPGYAGPQGANVLNDFGVVFGDADALPDLDGNARVADGDNDGSAIVDMGAYERQLDLCPADINNSGAVDVDDLIAVILGWGCTSPPGSCAADVDGSGAVNVDDLIAVILGWGSCP